MQIRVELVHGGQTGVDRGGHEAALDIGWSIHGFMPLSGRDERGSIPPEIARHLQRCARSGFLARTEENVRIADALLVVVPDADDPRVTPGTAKTLDFAKARNLRRVIAEPSTDIWQLASWLRNLCNRQLLLGDVGMDPTPVRLMVAGPRESKWPRGRVETAGLLRRVAGEIVEIERGTSTEQNRRLPRAPSRIGSIR